MFKIKQENRLNLAVFIFFIVAFIIFLYLSPEEKITGMSTVSQVITANQTIYFSNSLVGGTITLSFALGDAIPVESIATLSIVNTTANVGDEGIKSARKTIAEIFGTNVQKNVTGCTADKDVTPDAFWEGKLRETYNFSDTQQFTIELKDFNLNVPDIPGSKSKNYSLVFNITWLMPQGTTKCDGTSPSWIPYNYNILSNITQITVRSNNVSLVNNIQLTNLSGGNMFKVNDYINCTATIIDVDNDNVIFNATFWGPSKNYNNPSKRANGDSSQCTGVSWETGKTCSVSVQITASDIIKNSDFGYWNCSITTFDGYGINISVNSTNAIKMNNTAVTFVGKFSNITWLNNTALTKEDAFKLEADSASGNGFYDPDSILNYSFKGNKSINISIKPDSYVNLTRPQGFLGLEYIVVYANDSFSRVQSNNFTINISSPVACTANWNCTAWSSCTNDVKDRTCTDLNSCDPNNLTKIETESCAIATCFDNIQNQNETGVDCGGPCPACAPAPPPQEARNISVAAPPSAKTIEESERRKKLILYTFIIIVALAALGAGGYFGFKYLKKVKKPKPVITLEEPVGERVTIQPVEEKFTPKIEIPTRPKEEAVVKPVNAEELRKYIREATANKIPASQIKEDLVKAGWDKKTVEEELNIASLRTYIRMKLNEGLTKDKIVETLKLKGWKEHLIEEAFKDLKSKPMF